MSESKGEGGRYTGGLHDPAELQKYAAELEKLAASIAHDQERAKELIDVFHTGDGANVEKFFLDAGVRTAVSIVERAVESPATVDGETADDARQVFAEDAAAHRHTHVEADIDLGFVHLHVEYDKDS